MTWLSELVGLPLHCRGNRRERNYARGPEIGRTAEGG
jgi:hypothetical protein